MGGGRLHWREFQGPLDAISRHTGRIKLPPPHYHRNMHQMKRLNGHNLGLELKFTDSTSNDWIFWRNGGISAQKSEMQQITSRPTAPNRFKQVHRNPPMDQIKRSDSDYLGMDSLFGKITPQNLKSRLTGGFWLNFLVTITSSLDPSCKFSSNDRTTIHPHTMGND